MVSVWTTILDELRQATTAALPTADHVSFEVPPDPAIGDLAVPCFALAKALQQPPPEIAQRLADHLAAHPLVARVDVAGAYVNITLDAGELARRVFGAMAQAGRGYGNAERRAQSEEHIVLEFVSPNANKPLHLGHLRNAFYGEAVARLLEAQGHQVHRVCLLNDRGIAMAKAMLAYERWGQGTTPESEGLKGDHFVGNWYVAFEQKAKADPALLTEAQELVRKWEAGDAATRAFWERLCGWVIAGHEATYAALGIHFERVYRESDISERGRAIVLSALERGIFDRDEKGNVVARLEDRFHLTDKVLVRADGTTIYTTQDIALVEAKEHDYPGSRSIVVTAVEQDFVFRQLFAVLDLLGVDAVQRMEHRSYEMVHLPEGKMKSREGTVVDADDLLAKLEALAIAEMEERADVVPGEPAAGTVEPPIVISDAARARAQEVAHAALRFMLLHVSPRVTVTFDPRAAVGFTGKTGPYLQYMHARACAIERRARAQETGSRKQETRDAALLTQPAEKQLLVLMARFPDVVAESATARDPSHLAHFCYDFAQHFAAFYRDVPVLQAESDALREVRLALVRACRLVLARGLALLGITSLEEM